jgi:hypothetical protein
MSTKLRDCAVCGKPVMPKQHQADTARTCSPMCAHTLASREHPDIERVPDRNDRLRSNGEPS